MLRALFTAFILLLPFVANATSRSPRPQPTVWIVTLDDFGNAYDARAPGTQTHYLASVSTPNLDRLNTEGARLNEFYVNPSCGTTRSSLHTGQFNLRNRLFGAVVEPPDLTIDYSLGRVASDAGVQAIAFGKIGAGGWGTYYWGPNELGWDYYDGLHDVQPADGFGLWDRTTSDLVRLTRYGGDPDAVPPYRENVPSSTYIDDFVTAQAINQFGARDHSRAAIVWLGLYNIHTPLHLPSDSGARATCSTTDQACFEAMYARMDALIGDVLNAMGPNDLALFFGDNGEVGAEAKGTIYEAGIRVPAYVYGKGVTAATPIEDSITLADVYATALDLTGVPLYGGAATLDGFSMATLFGEPCDWTGSCWINRTGIVAVGESATGRRAYRDTIGDYAGYKLIYTASSQVGALYDLTSYAGFGKETGDLCSSGDCSGLTGTDRLAWNSLCDGLVAFETDAGAPMADPCDPVLLDAPTFGTPTSDDTSVSATFSAEASGDAVSYESCVYETSAGSGACSWATDTSPVDNTTGLTPGTNYTLKVRGVDADDRAGAEDTETISTTGGAGGGAGACTDGVNCLCDTISPVSTLLLCEDFEAAGYYEDTAASWRAGSGSPHNRGGDSEWENKWGNADGNLWSNISEPFSPYLGTACGFGPSTGHQGCTGTKEYCSAAQGALTSYGAADCWGPTTNDGARVDMQRSGDFDAEVGTLTLTGGIGVTPDVLAGNTTLAYRLGPGSQAGKFGDAWLLAGNGGVGGTPVDGNTNATEIGITMLLAYSSNIGTEADSVIDAQWKHNEWATDGQGSQEHWNLGNSGCGDTTDFPYRPFLWATSEGACITALSGATETVGNAACSDAPALMLCSTTAYDQATDFPYGTVACHQAHIKGLGTNDVDIEIKHNGTTVIKLENFDGSALRNSYYSNFIWNAYSNINEDNDGTANDTDEAQYRYEDNIVVVQGPPESCASIGF